MCEQEPLPQAGFPPPSIVHPALTQRLLFAPLLFSGPGRGKVNGEAVVNSCYGINYPRTEKIKTTNVYYPHRVGQPGAWEQLGSDSSSGFCRRW